MDVAPPVRKQYFVPAALPREVYAVVADFAAYPRLFPEFSSTRIISVDGRRHRVEFRGQIIVGFRYVLDLDCDPDALTIEWQFVAGEIITGSTGGWVFREDGGGTEIDYRVSLEVKAPVPALVLRKITDALISASLPAMFSALAREVAHRKRGIATRA